MSDSARSENTIPTMENEAAHRLTAQLATLDLDPPTVEILTAVLTADLEPTPTDAPQ
ncbi:MAG: hypothetical protein AB1679_07175 [Actinomycetota bacterium]|jgi:hypothetical protein